MPFEGNQSDHMLRLPDKGHCRLQGWMQDLKQMHVYKIFCVKTHFTSDRFWCSALCIAWNYDTNHHNWHQKIDNYGEAQSFWPNIKMWITILRIHEFSSAFTFIFWVGGGGGGAPAPRPPPLIQPWVRVIREGHS